MIVISNNSNNAINNQDNKNNNRVIMGFEFEEEEVYRQAKRELDNILKIKKNYHIKNKEKQLEFYNKLIDEKIFVTSVGMEYLRNLQKELYDSDSIENSRISNIPAVIYTGKPSKVNHLRRNTISFENEGQEMKASALQRRVEKYKSNFVKMFIVNIALVIVICVMLIMTKNAEKYDLDYYRESIENEYLEWENNLREREAALSTPPAP